VLQLRYNLCRSVPTQAKEFAMTDHVAAAWLAHLRNDTHPSIAEQVAPDVLDAALRVTLELALERCHDQVFASRFHTSCPVEGAQRHDYLHRHIKVPNATLLAGIRFKGLRLDAPFVELIAASQPLDTLDLEVCWQILRDTFAIFTPRWIRAFEGARPWRQQLAPARPHHVDLHVLAAPIPALLNVPAPPTLGRVRVHPVRPEVSYPRYADAHRAWRASDALASEVLTADHDDFVACAREGALLDAFVGGQWAGVIGARPGTWRGLTGFEVFELFLDVPFRGQGLAVALQRHLLRVLEPRAHTQTWLFGTIHDRNRASLATARRMQRVDVGSWVFVDLSP